MQFGLFCTYENPQQDVRSAYAEQAELVQLVETLGFDEAWVAEHHFNPNAASPSSLSILAYLAGRTTRLRLGSAAILLAFRDPVLVAEDVATLDILSGGRFNFGAAKGGPFPHQNRHFGLTPDAAREKTKEALTLIQRLLYEERVCFQGAFFKCGPLQLTPKPIQTPIPTFLATSTAEMITLAAEQGYGLMAGPPFPLDVVEKYLALYRAASPAGDPRLTLMRFYHLAETQEQAVTEARELLESFVDRMRESTATLQPGWTPWMEMDRLIADSLIGTETVIRAKLAQLQEAIGPRAVVLKPLSPTFEKRRHDLRVFGEQFVQCHGHSP